VCTHLDLVFVAGEDEGGGVADLVVLHRLQEVVQHPVGRVGLAPRLVV
jgi:hypothetical protein